MPNQGLQQAARELDNQPLAPDIRKRRAKELKKIRDGEIKERRKRLNDRLGKAKAAYQEVNEAQSALEDEYTDLAAQEGRMSAAEYQRHLEELNRRQRGLEASRDRHRTELVKVGEAMDALEEDPDAVIDEFYDRYSALPKPTRDLEW